jgi:hypothetical protein
LPIVKLVSAQPAECECKSATPGAASFAAIDSCVTVSSKTLSLKHPYLCSASLVQVAQEWLAACILIFAFQTPRRVISGNLKARYNQKGFGNKVLALSH